MKRILLVTAISLCWVSPAFASESIPSFDTAVVAGTDSSLTVTETVVYDMDTVERHGLERIIPKSSDQGPDIVIRDVSATRDGSPDGVHVTNSGGDTTIRIGDPDVTMTGEHTYVLSYTVLNGVRYFDDKDEVYWNVIPQGMRMPIAKSSATVTLPESSTVTAGPFCYTGPEGSKDTDCKVSISGLTVKASALHAFTTGEGMTVAVAIEPGAITRVAPVKDSASGWFVLIPVLFIGCIIFVLIFFKAVLSAKGGIPRKRSDGGDIVVQYDAPPGCTAPDAAYIADGGRSGRFFTSAVVQLAIDGWLTMKFSEVKKWFWTKHEITFKRKKEGTPQDPVLELAMEALFTSGDEKTLTELKKEARAGTVRVDKIAAGIPTVLLRRGWTEKYGLFKLFTRTTPAGRVANEHLAGLKMYIGAAEKERLEFHNAPEHSPATFEKLLPYAIALSVDEPWIKTFGDLQYVPEWTDSSSAMNMSMMSSTIGQLSSGVSSVMNAYSSGTSGSGGGGSSGGGGGGGGGGGW